MSRGDVAFRFKKANCVAVGTFNIYIVQPEWLTAVEIFPDKTEILIEANLRTPGFRISSPKLRTTWAVAPDRLTIETSFPDEDCGGRMATVLERLRWTPVRAVGNNVTFEADAGEASESAVLTACSLISMPSGYGNRGKSVSVAMEREGRVYNIVLQAADSSLVLRGNVHTDVSAHMDTEAAQAAARAFREDVTVLQSLTADVFGVEVEDVASNVGS